MNTVIVITDNSKIEKGSIVQYTDEGHGTKMCIVKDLGGYEDNPTVFLNEIRFVSEKWIQKVQFLVVDTLAGVDAYNVQYEWNNTKHPINLNVNNEWIDIYSTPQYKDGKQLNQTLKRYQKIIATSDSSLPLPQLSPQAIELIIEKNGEIGEFDIEIKRVTQGHSRSLKLVEIANIIPKSSKQSIEQAAEKYCNENCNVMELDYSHPVKAFIAGANHFKEYHTKNMYSEQELLSILEFIINNVYTCENEVGTLFINNQLYDNPVDLLNEYNYRNKK